jgi:hypothetical protein
MDGGPVNSLSPWPPNAEGNNTALSGRSPGLQALQEASRRVPGGEILPVKLGMEEIPY